MKTKMTVLIAISIIALFLAATTSACGSGEEDSEVVEVERLASAPAQPAAPAHASLAEQQAMQIREVVKEVQVPGETVVVEKEVVREVEVEKTVELTRPAAPAAPASQTVRGSDDGLVPQPAQLATQRRIIIRTVNISIVVDEIQAAIDDIARIADEAGGWMVSSDHSLKHAGSISIRVPATGLDSVVETLRDLATDVESETNSSQDVTDEYYDLQSRLKNQRATPRKR